MEEFQRRGWEWISLRIDQTDLLMYSRRTLAEGEIKVERRAANALMLLEHRRGHDGTNSHFQFRCGRFCSRRLRVSCPHWEKADCIRCLHSNTRCTNPICADADGGGSTLARPNGGALAVLMEDTSGSAAGGASSASRTSEALGEWGGGGGSPDQVPQLMYVD